MKQKIAIYLIFTYHDITHIHQSHYLEECSLDAIDVIMLISLAILW